jgi:hypothetical protein
MTRICMLVLLATIWVVTGCRSNSGSQEFVPGKGWKNTRVTQPSHPLAQDTTTAPPPARPNS